MPAPRKLQRGEPITEAWLADLCDAIDANTLLPGKNYLITRHPNGGCSLNIRIPRQPTSSTTATIQLARTTGSFTSGTQLNAQPCDANGVDTPGTDPIDIYLYAGGGTADLGSVSLAGTTHAVSCGLASGKIIAYGTAGSDHYLVGDILPVIRDTRIQGGTLQARVYWRVGIAVSTLSDWIDIGPAAAVQFGKLTTALTASATTVTLTPCDPAGNATGASNVTVRIKWDNSAFDPSKDENGETITAGVAQDTVLAYLTASDSNNYLIQQPQCVVSRSVYSDSAIKTYHRWLLGGAQSTEGTDPVARITFYTVTVHQVQWDADNKKLQYRTGTVMSPLPESWGAWTDLLEYECLTADTINSLTGSTGGGSYS